MKQLTLLQVIDKCITFVNSHNASMNDGICTAMCKYHLNIDDYPTLNKFVNYYNKLRRNKFAKKGIYYNNTLAYSFDNNIQRLKALHKLRDRVIKNNILK